MLSKSVIKRFNTEERNFLRDGAIFMTLFAGGVSYWNYRQYIRKDFYRSEAHYRFNSRT